MNYDQNVYDLIVIGGGSSGLMMAGCAAERGASVLILEKNDDLGKKLQISGGGRCNIYNAEFDTKKLLENYGEAKKFLYSPFSKFAAQESADFFQRIGLETVIQARNRAFPSTERAYDVYNALVNYCKKTGVEVRLNTPVTKISQEDGEISTITSKKEVFRAHNYALATGGNAKPETGSTGDGFKYLEKLGHTINKPTPNIVPLTTSEDWVKRLAGTSLSFMKIRFMQDDKIVLRRTGKILFTHFGISGPLILNVAGEVKDLLAKGTITASVDMFPDTEIGDLDRRIWRIFEQHKNKQVKNIITELLPKNLGLAILGMLPTDISKKSVNDVSKEERMDLAKICKDLRFPITGSLGWDKAVIADGGITLEEVDFKTMRSTIFPNLYLLGDILHVNRPSGGFSLQLCWTTAWVAAQSVSIAKK